MDKNFYEEVFNITKQIPFGKVTTYGIIAKCLGSAQSSRMVGWALNTSHIDKEIPAHRVVNRNGCLSGKIHFETPEMMQQLLEKEGLQIINDQIVDFKKHLWNPLQEYTNR